MVERNESGMIDNTILVEVEVGLEGLNINDFPFNHVLLKETMRQAAFDAAMQEARRQLREMQADGTLEKMYGPGYRVEGL